MPKWAKSECHFTDSNLLAAEHLLGKETRLFRPFKIINLFLMLNATDSSQPSSAVTMNLKGNIITGMDFRGENAGSHRSCLRRVRESEIFC
jgi:hypothetical protein